MLPMKISNYRMTQNSDLSYQPSDPLYYTSSLCDCREFHGLKYYLYSTELLKYLHSNILLALKYNIANEYSQVIMTRIFNRHLKLNIAKIQL